MKNPRMPSPAAQHDQVTYSLLRYPHGFAEARVMTRITAKKAAEPPNLPELRRLFVASLTGHVDDPEALADDLESTWLLPVWKQWQTGAGKHFPAGLKVHGPRERRDELQGTADKLRAVLPELCDAYRCALSVLRSPPAGADRERADNLAEMEDGNRFALGAYAELLRVVATIEEAASFSDECTHTGPASWSATPETRVARGLRLQLEKRGIVCRNKAAEPYRHAAGWVWPYLDLTGAPARYLRDELRRNTQTTSPAPALSAWLSRAAM
jgi:hypothetical protein